MIDSLFKISDLILGIIKQNLTNNKVLLWDKIKFKLIDK